MNCDPQIIDHADDVFYLLWISNVIRQMIVNFLIGQITLLSTTTDKLF